MKKEVVGHPVGTPNHLCNKATKSHALFLRANQLTPPPIPVNAAANPPSKAAGAPVLASIAPS